MKITELDAELLRREPDGVTLTTVATVSEATSVMFDCPACRRHSVLVHFRGRVPDDADPGARWDVAGTTVEDLTLSPSVDLTGATDCGWHGFVQNGEAKP